MRLLTEVDRTKVVAQELKERATRQLGGIPLRPLGQLILRDWARLLATRGGADCLDGVSLLNAFDQLDAFKDRGST